MQINKSDAPYYKVENKKHMVIPIDVWKNIS